MQQEIKVLKRKIDKAKSLKLALNGHHPQDDDPTGEFYTVRQQRVKLTQNIRRWKEQIAELKGKPIKE